jgi:hypothetical protein
MADVLLIKTLVVILASVSSISLVARAGLPAAGGYLLAGLVIGPHAHPWSIPMPPHAEFSTIMSAPIGSRITAFASSMHTWCTRKPRCTRMAMFTQSHSDPADANFCWKHSFPNYIATARRDKTGYVHT